MLGFRWPLSDTVAPVAAEEFYKSLAKEGELDLAALDMRSALYKNPDDDAWLSPILIVQH